LDKIAQKHFDGLKVKKESGLKAMLGAFLGSS